MLNDWGLWFRAFPREAGATWEEDEGGWCMEVGIFITPNRNTCSDNNNKVKYWDLTYLKSVMTVKNNSSWVIYSANLHLKQKQTRKKPHRTFGPPGKSRVRLLCGLGAPHLHKGGVDFTWLLWSQDQARLPGALPCCQRQYSPGWRSLRGRARAGIWGKMPVVKCQEVTVFHSSQVDTHPTSILMSLKSEFILHLTPSESCVGV